MEYILLCILYAALLIFDFLPGLKQHSRKESVLYALLAVFSLGGLICAVCFDTLPTVSKLLSALFRGDR